MLEIIDLNQEFGHIFSVKRVKVPNREKERIIFAAKPQKKRKKYITHFDSISRYIDLFFGIQARKTHFYLPCVESIFLLLNFLFRSQNSIHKPTNTHVYSACWAIVCMHFTHAHIQADQRYRAIEWEQKNEQEWERKRLSIRKTSSFLYDELMCRIYLCDLKVPVCCRYSWVHVCMCCICVLV